MKDATCKEIRELGVVQEVNRLLLHPLGLALAAVLSGDDDDTSIDFKVLDFRDDKAGVIYPEGKNLETKAAVFAALQKISHPPREAELGYIIQPTKQKNLNENQSH